MTAEDLCISGVLQRICSPGEGGSSPVADLQSRRGWIFSGDGSASPVSFFRRPFGGLLGSSGNNLDGELLRGDPWFLSPMRSFAAAAATCSLNRGGDWVVSRQLSLMGGCPSGWWPWQPRVAKAGEYLHGDGSLLQQVSGRRLPHPAVCDPSGPVLAGFWSTRFLERSFSWFFSRLLSLFAHL